MTGRAGEGTTRLRLRSLLFVPGDRPERMRKALSLGADALIIDLEDAVAPAAKARARAEVAALLAEARGDTPVFVRINALEAGHVEEDLAVLTPVRPAGIVLPKAEGRRSVETLDQLLRGQGDATTPIMPIVTETPLSMFRIGEYAEGCPRLAALAWGAEDLSAAVGAATARQPDGRFTAPYEMARSLTLFAAVAAGVMPIDTVYPDIGDLEGLERYARRAARDGFAGMMAVHPSQVAVINAAFTPSAEEVERARAIVAAFDAAPEVGAIMLDGKMVDQPHLRHAQAVLARV